MSLDAWSSMRRPGEGKYARLECERRFLLSEIPADATTPWLVEDRYLVGTRLRLRRVEAASQVVYKFCQKVRPDEGDPSVVAITNFYLSEPEYEQLCLVPARVLRKTRRRWRVGHHMFAVDEFQGDLAGLLLAEVELADVRQEVPVGPPIRAEVTHDDRFAGGYLANATSAQISELFTLIRES